jgi:hypothetical protein
VCASENQLKRINTQLTTICTLKHRKYIHCTRLSDRLAEQPQQLLIPKSSSGALRNEARRIVQAKLVATRATGPRSHLVAHGEQRDALAILIADIRACGREDHIERCVSRRRDAERGSRADERRPDVEATSSRARNPARLEGDEALDEGENGIWVEWLVMNRYV